MGLCFGREVAVEPEGTAGSYCSCFGREVAVEPVGTAGSYCSCFGREVAVEPEGTADKGDQRQEASQHAATALAEELPFGATLASCTRCLHNLRTAGSYCLCFGGEVAVKLGGTADKGDQRQEASQHAAIAPAEELLFGATLASCIRCLHNLWTETVTSASAKRLPAVLPRYASLGASFVGSMLLQPPSEVPTLPDIGVQLERHWTASSQAPAEASGEISSTSPQATAAVSAAGLIRSALDVMKRMCPEDSEFQLDAAMADDVIEMLQRTHAQSERMRRRADSGSWKNRLARQEREKVILWLFQLGTATSLSDDVIFTAVALLDRLHCALDSDKKDASSSGIAAPFSQLTVLAVLCTSLKIVGGQDEKEKALYLREFLLYICKYKFLADEVFKAELAVLSTLGFHTQVHTAYTALEALAVPLASPDTKRATPVIALAKFILQLSLLEPEMQRCYSGTVLAASSLVIALRCRRGSSCDPQILALLSDTATICGQVLTN